MHKGRLFVAASAALLCLAGTARADGAAMTREADIALDGAGFFDYVFADADGGRIYLAHGPKIEVIDAKKGAKVGEVAGVDGSHGTAIVSALKRGFATAGKKNKLVVFDTESLKTTKEIDTGAGPDGILFVRGANEVWTFNGHGKSATCVDADKLDVKATIDLGGKPEAAVEDADKGLVYVDLEDQSAICVVDVKKHAVVATHALEGAEEPSGLAFDAKDGLLFAGCGGKLAVVDAASWKTVKTIDIGDHCDGCAFDAGTMTGYASCGDGTTAVWVVKDGKTVEAKTPLATEQGARTCSVDAKTHKLYIATGPRRGQKGSVKVLVFSPK